MLLVAVAMLSAITTMHFAIHGAEVQVPALKGMTVAEARSQTAGMGLNLEVDNRYYSARWPRDISSPSRPRQASVVRREWRVRVSESLGPQKVEVPDTVGTDERVAALQLRRVGLDVGVQCAIARMPQFARRHRDRAGSARRTHRASKAQREPARRRARRRCCRRLRDARSYRVFPS